MEPVHTVETPATTVKFDLANELLMSKYDSRKREVSGHKLSFLKGKSHPAPLVRVFAPSGRVDKAKVIIPGMDHEALTPRGLIDGILNGSQKVGEWGNFIRVENAGSPTANRTVGVDMHPTLAGEAMARCIKNLGLNADEVFNSRNHPDVNVDYLNLLKTETNPYIA